MPPSPKATTQPHTSHRGLSGKARRLICSSSNQNTTQQASATATENGPSSSGCLNTQVPGRVQDGRRRAPVQVEVPVVQRDVPGPGGLDRAALCRVVRVGEREQLRRRGPARGTGALAGTTRPRASKYTLPVSVKCQLPAVAKKVKPTASATKMTIGTADPRVSRRVGVGAASTGTAAGSSSSDGGGSTRREITQSGQRDLLRQERW